MIEKLEEEVREKEVIDLRHFTDSFMVDVISKSSLGFDLDPFNDPENPIFVNLKRIFQFENSYKTFLAYIYPKIAALFDLTFFNGQSQRIIFTNMKRVINERLKKNIELNDLLQNLLDSSVMSNKSERKFKSFESKSISDI